MNVTKIGSGNHRGDYIVEIDGVKKIKTYADILELQEKEKQSEIKVKTEPITFPDNNIEPTIVDVEETPVAVEEVPKKKKPRKKK